MQQLTAEDILAMIGQSSKHAATKETDFTNDAEMYSVSSNKKEKKKENLNKNTFQQSSVNVRGQAPAFSSGAAHPGVKQRQEIPGIPGDQKVGITEQKYGRKFSHQNDRIIEMHLQFSHVKEGNRHSRVKAYLSLKTESDSRYMIFMRSALTSAVDETFRSIRNDCDKVLESEASEVYSNHYYQGLFMGRVKYKPVKGNKIEKHHRENLPLTLLSAWIEDGYWHAKFYFLDRDYEFILDEEISAKQKPFYSAQGTWSDEASTLTIEEAFGG
jgi:hypothetical protein